MTYDSCEDTSAKEHDAVVLAQSAAGVADALGDHNLERRKEPRDSSLAGLVAARGPWRNVWQGKSCIGGRKQERDERSVKGCAYLDGVTDITTSFKKRLVLLSKAPLRVQWHIPRYPIL